MAGGVGSCGSCGCRRLRLHSSQLRGKIFRSNLACRSCCIEAALQGAACRNSISSSCLTLAETGLHICELGAEALPACAESCSLAAELGDFSDTSCECRGQTRMRLLQCRERRLEIREATAFGRKGGARFFESRCLRSVGTLERSVLDRLRGTQALEGDACRLNRVVGLLQSREVGHQRVVLRLESRVLALQTRVGRDLL